MALFSYTAKQGPQKTVQGRIEADNLDSAIKKIIELGYTPIDVSKEEERSSALNFVFSKKVPAREIILFTRQLSDLIEADVPLLKSINHIHKQTNHPVLKEMLGEIHTSVKDGSMLSESLEKFPETFAPVYVNLIKSGEISGNLNQVMQRLAEFSERQQDTEMQIKASLVYPSLIMTVGAITIFVLLTWVIPRLSAIFDDLNQTLPLPTQILLGLSSFFSHFWWLIALVIFGLGFALRQMSLAEEGRLKIDTFKLKLPIFGNFLRNVEIERFSRTLATLLDNGVTIVAALKSVALVMENQVFKNALSQIETDVNKGESLAHAIEKISLFPETASQMITIGEETGHLAKGLYKLAQYYERLIQRFIKNMTTLIEPILILVMGTIVGSVVMAMLLPIFQMNMLIK